MCRNLQDNDCQLGSNAAVNTRAGRLCSNLQRQAISLTPKLVEDCPDPPLVQSQPHPRCIAAALDTQPTAEPAWHIAAVNRSHAGSQQEAQLRLPANSSARLVASTSSLDCPASDGVASESTAERTVGDAIIQGPQDDQSLSTSHGSHQLIESVEKTHQLQPALADGLPLGSLPGTETYNDIPGIIENPMDSVATPDDSQPSCQQHAAGLQTPQHLTHMQHITVAASNAVSVQTHAATDCMSGRSVASVVSTPQRGSAAVHLSPRKQRRAAERSIRLDQAATARAETKQALIANAPSLVRIATCVGSNDYASVCLRSANSAISAKSHSHRCKLLSFMQFESTQSR